MNLHRAKIFSQKKTQNSEVRIVWCLVTLALLLSANICEATCPDGTPLVYCFADPCQVNNCPAYPDATCISNYCGGCNAIFYDESGNEVDCGVPGCPDGIDSVICSVDPCEVNECPGYSDAECVSNNCGGCNAVFYDADGSEIACEGAGAPQAVYALSIQPTTAFVYFSPPADSSDVSFYRIYYQASVAGSVVQGPVDVATGESDSPLMGTLTGLTQHEHYYVWVHAVDTTGVQGPSSAKDHLLVGAAGCPEESTEAVDTAFGEITVFNTEGKDGREQLTVLVPYDRDYVGGCTYDCEDDPLPEGAGAMTSMSFQFGSGCSECNIPQDSFTAGTLGACAQTFDISSTCASAHTSYNWGIARLDFAMTHQINVNAACGFEKTTTDDSLIYSVDFVVTAHLAAFSLFGSTEGLQHETIIRTISASWPRFLEDSVLLTEIFGAPVLQMQLTSSIFVEEEIHEIDIVNRFQFPYVIEWAELRRIDCEDYWNPSSDASTFDSSTSDDSSASDDTTSDSPSTSSDASTSDSSTSDDSSASTSDDPNKYPMVIGPPDEDCLIYYSEGGTGLFYDSSDITSGDSNSDDNSIQEYCTQVVSLSSETSDYEFPLCDEDLCFRFRIKLKCTQHSGIQCNTINAGAYFHLSTTFCPDLLVIGELDAQLKAYGSLDTDPATGIVMAVPTEERTAFAYQAMMYYEIMTTGFTSAGAVIESFTIGKREPDSGEITVVHTFAIDDATPEPMYGEGQPNVPTINVLKQFGAAHQPDSIIFKHIVNEYTFPEYPTDLSVGMGFYVATCVVRNLGFRRKLQTEIDFGALANRQLFEEDRTTSVLAIGVAPMYTSDGNGTSGHEEVQVGMYNDGTVEAEGSESASSFLIIAASVGAVGLLVIGGGAGAWVFFKSKANTKPLELTKIGKEHLQETDASFEEMPDLHVPAPKNAHLPSLKNQEFRVNCDDEGTIDLSLSSKEDNMERGIQSQEQDLNS